MKKIFTILLSIFFTCTILSAGVTPEISIDSITTKNLDKVGKNYTLEIIFTPKKMSIKNWKFGFYMPRKFNQLLDVKNEVNPNLTMSVSDASDKKIKEKLKYIYTKSGKSLSAGYTSVFAPAKAFKLKKNTKYKITLKNSNQWSQGNYSSVAQSLFLLYYRSDSSDCKPKIINISTKPENYKIDGYDQAKISNEIKNQLTGYLRNSNSNASLADNYSIVPTPVSIEKTVGGFNFSRIKSINIYTDNCRNLAISSIKQIKIALKKDLRIKSKLNREIPKTLKSGLLFKKLNKSEIIKKIRKDIN
jgi:hexosaminidase